MSKHSRKIHGIWKGRSRPLLVLLVLSLLAVYVAIPAGAVHDLDFQLEGNLADDAAAPEDFDWESFFNSTGTPTPALPDLSRPGFKQSSFSQDFVPGAHGPDRTTFATGSKDILDITPGWQCSRSANTNDKIDILNAYAVTFTDGTDDYLYFALERFSNDGDANVAFWFLQDPDVGCLAPATGPSNTAFTGDHVDGDLLIVSAFTKGGVVSTVTVYKWVGGVGGSLQPTGITGVDCKVTTGPDTVCATVNTGNITPIWPTEDKDDDNVLNVSEFYEGGLNLSDLGLGGACFTTFLANTRSSQELTATLFDFASGTLPACQSAIVTAPSDASIVLGDTITDTATVTGTGVSPPPEPTGKVKFFICSPTQLDVNGECSSGGTQIDVDGDEPDGEVLDPGTITNDGIATATSDAFEPTAVGTWCFRGEYSGDDNYDAAEDFDAARECFEVTDESFVSTEQDWLPNDTATITSTGGSLLSGDVLFELFESADCTGTAVYTDTDTLSDAASGTTTSTENTTVYTDNVTVSWKVSFDSTNDVADAPAVCETSSIANYDNDVPIGTPAP